MSAVYTRESLPALITAYRQGHEGSDAALIDWLYSYVKTVVRVNYKAQDADREDVGQDIIAWLIDGLPQMMGRLDLRENPSGYILTVIFNRLRRVLETMGKLQYIDQQTRAEFLEIHPYPPQPRPDELAATEEMRRLARRAVFHSIMEFRLPRWRNSYTAMVAHWIETGEERVASKVPWLVRSVMFFRLRSTVRRALVAKYARQT